MITFSTLTQFRERIEGLLLTHICTVVGGKSKQLQTMRKCSVYKGGKAIILKMNDIYSNA